MAIADPSTTRHFNGDDWALQRRVLIQAVKKVLLMLEDLAAADRWRADGRRGRRRGAAVAAVVHTRLTLVQPPAKEVIKSINDAGADTCLSDHNRRFNRRIPSASFFTSLQLICSELQPL